MYPTHAMHAQPAAECRHTSGSVISLAEGMLLLVAPLVLQPPCYLPTPLPPPSIQTTRSIPTPTPPNNPPGHRGG